MESDLQHELRRELSGVRRNVEGVQRGLDQSRARSNGNSPTEGVDYSVVSRLSEELGSARKSSRPVSRSSLAEWESTLADEGAQWRQKDQAMRQKTLAEKIRLETRLNTNYKDAMEEAKGLRAQAEALRKELGATKRKLDTSRDENESLHVRLTDAQLQIDSLTSLQNPAAASGGSGVGIEILAAQQTAVAAYRERDDWKQKAEEAYKVRDEYFATQDELRAERDEMKAEIDHLNDLLDASGQRAASEKSANIVELQESINKLKDQKMKELKQNYDDLAEDLAAARFTVNEHEHEKIKLLEGIKGMQATIDELRAGTRAADHAHESAAAWPPHGSNFGDDGSSGAGASGGALALLEAAKQIALLQGDNHKLRSLLKSHWDGGKSTRGGQASEMIQALEAKIANYEAELAEKVQPASQNDHQLYALLRARQRQIDAYKTAGANLREFALSVKQCRGGFSDEAQDVVMNFDSDVEALNLLPRNFEVRRTSEGPDGVDYYIDHARKTTSWFHPGLGAGHQRPAVGVAIRDSSGRFGASPGPGSTARAPQRGSSPGSNFSASNRKLANLRIKHGSR